MPLDRRDLRRRLFNLAGGQAGYFSAAQARALGYSYQAQAYHVAAANWLRIDRGIFRLAEWLPDVHDDLARWKLWSKDRAVVSHESALSVHGIGEFESSRIHLTVPPGFSMRDDAVVIHVATLADEDVTEHTGFRVTTPLRSIVDVAARSPDEEQLGRAIDEAQRAGLLTLRALRARADALDARAALRIERASRLAGAVMPYETPQAFRMALERRLLTRSNETGVALDRLRRRVMFERIVARLAAAEPGRWVLKGGMALEVRLRDAARLTKDIDLGLRADVREPGELRERLIDALGLDVDGDRFGFIAGTPEPLREDGGGYLTWRVKVAATLAGKHFGGIRLDISPRAHELDLTERMALPNSLDFADVPAPVVEIVDVHRHAAEKFHAMLRDFGDRENTRVRDLVDLVMLIEHGLLTASAVAAATRRVWSERDGAEPPGALPPLPASWADGYERSAADNGLATTAFPDAVAIVGRLWAHSVAAQET